MSENGYRTCSKCGESKLVSPTTWKYRKNRPAGLKCKTCVAKTKRAWDLRNKAHVDEYRVKRGKALRKHISAKSNEYQKARRLRDPVFRLRCNIRSMLAKQWSRYCAGVKPRNAEVTVGLSISELYKYLIDTALRNYGFYLYDEVYHIDHIRPLASANSEEEIIALHHYTNLQLLYARDNLVKNKF